MTKPSRELTEARAKLKAVEEKLTEILRGPTRSYEWYFRQIREAREIVKGQL